MHDQLKTTFDQVQAAVYFDTTIVKGGDLRSSGISRAPRRRSTPGGPWGLIPTSTSSSIPTPSPRPSLASRRAPRPARARSRSAGPPRAMTGRNLITYRVFRDGGSTPIGQVQSSSTTTVSFTDTRLAAGSAHTYEVDASDGANMSVRSVPSDPITVASGPAPVFTDTFDSGFTNWTFVRNLTIDQTTGAVPPSARPQVSGLAAYARETLSQTYPSLCPVRGGQPNLDRGEQRPPAATRRPPTPRSHGSSSRRPGRSGSGPTRPGPSSTPVRACRAVGTRSSFCATIGTSGPCPRGWTGPPSGAGRQTWGRTPSAGSRSWRTPPRPSPPTWTTWWPRHLSRPGGGSVEGLPRRSARVLAVEGSRVDQQRSTVIRRSLTLVAGDGTGS